METNNKQWYEQLFTNYARQYQNEPFTQGTLQEVSFIEAELKDNRNSSILDIGCGAGRHSVELARRGYRVTGIDLSENMLCAARQNAQEAQVTIRFIRADARNLRTDEKFDAAIMLCEGGFSLMETDEMNFQILKTASMALKPGGVYIFTCLNALFPIFHSIKEKMMDGTLATYDQSSFDLATFRDHSTFSFTDDDGKVHQLNANERYYAPSELMWMMKNLGFSKVEIFGGEVGNFSRNKSVTGDSFELLVIAAL
jgi:2-polyprenyl-3-methyl-5-hydroxy-6-metoxy-1,4-benzoquinol methylase